MRRREFIGGVVAATEFPAAYYKSGSGWRTAAVKKEMSSTARIRPPHHTPDPDRAPFRSLLSDATELFSRRRGFHSCRAATPSNTRYWTILSALTSTSGGMVNPSALAVLRLMTNSNFVGRSTGSSDGLVPLRIRST